MDDPLWDPERLRVVGSVLSRYASHLDVGHRVRLGMEGDPCSTFRSVDDAPRATVTEVTREANGDVRFRARLDGSDALVELDNRNVAPDRLWEIDPDYLDAFRAHVQRAADDDQPASAASPTSPPAPAPPVDSEYRSSVQHSFERLEKQLDDIEATNRSFRETMASTVRALAGDLLRASRGTPIEFAHQYADRYDLAVAERVSDGVVDGYRGDSPRANKRGAKRADGDVFQGEKFDFEEHGSQLAASVREDASALTDE